MPKFSSGARRRALGVLVLLPLSGEPARALPRPVEPGELPEIDSGEGHDEVMSTLAEQAIDALRDAGAVLTPGLTADELARLEEQWEIVFSSDHAAFLKLAVPLGEGWVDWRGAAEPIAHLLAQPVDGLLHDVVHNDFWPASWGAKATDQRLAVDVATEQLGRWPRLLPLYDHRYLPSGPLASPSPVLSVVQSDVTYSGFTLMEWVQREFFGVSLPASPAKRPEIRAWTKLAEGCEDRDL